MKTDKVLAGVLIIATLPPDGESYVWPKGVTKIGNSAFFGWESYNQPFVIPEGVTNIGGHAFCGWSSYNLPFVIPEGVTEIGGCAFDGWLAYNQPFVIPEGVTEIGGWAFFGWSSYNQPNCRRAKAANDWLRIGDWVFAGCWSGRLPELRARLDSGESTPEREAAWKAINEQTANS